MSQIKKSEESRKGIVNFVTHGTLVFFHFGPCKRQSNLLASTDLVVLKLTHSVHTVVQGAEFQKTHPFVFVVLLPIHLVNRASNGFTNLPDLGLHFWMGKCHIQNFRGWVAVGQSSKTFTLVFVLFFILGNFFEHQALVMRIENLKIGFGIVYLIFGLNGRKQSLELYQCATFLFDVNDFADSTEVRKDVIEAIMIVVLRQRSYKKYLGWAVFYQKLLGIGVDKGFGFPPRYLNGVLPFSEFCALERNLSELLVYIHQIIERAALMRFFG